ncbi:MAG TPA: D-glycerate dehydrogenase [Candidatus Acidoferrales bacterium]|nr:D-glycerate dehydrogenase [Candidatus Acidoferrales bacterium]
MSALTAVFAIETYPSVYRLVEEVAAIAGLERLADADGIFCDMRLRLDEATLAQAPKLRVIAAMPVGYENIDLAACARRGIVVSNGRGTLNEAVADLSHALILASLRRLLTAVEWARSGRWMNEPAPFGHDLEGKTLGIAGFGEIGLAVARRAQASRMKVMYTNRRPRADDALTGASFVPFEQLLETADCVLALVPLSAATRHLFGRAEFARMKPTAHFVNVGRGALVDTEALVEALQAGRLAGAALDVTDPEPLPPDHPLYTLPNVTIVPHIGSATPETRERMALQAGRNLVAGLLGRPLLTPVPMDGLAANR